MSIVARGVCRARPNRQRSRWGSASASGAAPRTRALADSASVAAAIGFTQLSQSPKLSPRMLPSLIAHRQRLVPEGRCAFAFVARRKHPPRRPHAAVAAARCSRKSGPSRKRRLHWRKPSICRAAVTAAHVESPPTTTPGSALPAVRRWTPSPRASIARVAGPKTSLLRGSALLVAPALARWPSWLR